MSQPGHPAAGNGHATRALGVIGYVAAYGPGWVILTCVLWWIASATPALIDQVTRGFETVEARQSSIVRDLTAELRVVNAHHREALQILERSAKGVDETSRAVQASHQRMEALLARIERGLAAVERRADPIAAPASAP